MSRRLLAIQELETDRSAAEPEQCFVDVAATVVADAEAAVLMQPIVCSTTHRFVPSREPCGVLGAAIFAWTRPRPRSRRLSCE
jgi:hypothetical protein